MRIAVAIPGDMHRTTGGFIYETAVLQELRALGHEVDYMQLPFGFPDPTDAEQIETLALLRKVPPNVPILLDGFIPGTVDPDGLAQVRAPVVPVIHHPLGMETGLSAARATFLLKNEAASLHCVARIVVPSPHTARLLIDDFRLDPARITVAEPGFGPSVGPGRPSDPPLILAVGLLAARKGHDILLDALSRLTDLDWQAWIVGGIHDPAIADALYDQTNLLCLSSRVTFTGKLSEDDLNQAYGSASIFALATRFEGYGMVFGDAMRHGLPIVTCRGGAVPDTVGDAARLVDVDDAGAFAGALRELLLDPDARLKLAKRSAQRGRGLPSWRDTAGKIAETLARALAERATGS